jgi:hypothetical protein
VIASQRIRQANLRELRALEKHFAYDSSFSSYSILNFGHYAALQNGKPFRHSNGLGKVVIIEVLPYWQ